MALAIEEAVCPDIFVSGVDHIERLDGGLVRIVYYVDRRAPDGTLERVVVAKFIRPAASLPQSIRMMAEALGHADIPFVADGGKIEALN